MTRLGLLHAVLRLLPLLWVTGCGGFNTPPQDVLVGLGLMSPVGTPPKVTDGDRTLVLNQLRLTGTATVGTALLAAFDARVVPLTAVWNRLTDGPLVRGEYQQLKLELSAMTLDGTWAADGAPPKPFSLTATGGRGQDFRLKTPWRVELGAVSTVSLVSDPRLWMSTNQNLEPIDPTAAKAGEQLMDRFFQSLTAVRDDNHDGVEDVMLP